MSHRYAPRLSRATLKKTFKNILYATLLPRPTLCNYCFKEDCPMLVTDDKKDCSFFHEPEAKEA
jgi:hypothetical protein